MTDVFGNYVIQKFFEHGSPEQKTALVQKVYNLQYLFFGYNHQFCEFIQSTASPQRPIACVANVRMSRYTKSIRIYPVRAAEMDYCRIGRKCSKVCKRSGKSKEAF